MICISCYKKFCFLPSFSMNQQFPSLDWLSRIICLIFLNLRRCHQILHRHQKWTLTQLILIRNLETRRFRPRRLPIAIFFNHTFRCLTEKPLLFTNNKLTWALVVPLFHRLNRELVRCTLVLLPGNLVHQVLHHLHNLFYQDILFVRNIRFATFMVEMV